MTIKLPTTQELLIVASHVVWFKTPEETLSNPTHFLAYLMTYGVHEDLKIVHKYLTIKAEDLSKLSFSIPNYKNTNFFHFHFYFILYLLAPLAFFIPSYAVICFFISLSFMGMVVLLYFFLRSKKINIWS